MSLNIEVPVKCETKQKGNGAKRDRNETNRNETKQIEMKQIDTERKESKYNKTLFMQFFGLMAFIEQKENDNNFNLSQIHVGLYIASALMISAETM